MYDKIYLGRCESPLEYIRCRFSHKTIRNDSQAFQFQLSNFFSHKNCWNFFLITKYPRNVSFLTVLSECEKTTADVRESTRKKNSSLFITSLMEMCVGKTENIFACCRSFNNSLSLLLQNFPERLRNVCKQRARGEKEAARSFPRKRIFRYYENEFVEEQIE